MSLFFWIVVGAALGALALGLFLKVRLSREQQVWDELVEPQTSETTDSESWHNSYAADRHEINMGELESIQDRQGEEMNDSSLSQSDRAIRDVELRRSTRLDRPVSLVVLGTNRRGEIFQERTAAVSVNLHGCRYSSRHEYAPEGWVTLQVTGTDGANSRPVRARVRSVFSAQTTKELCQVGVELEQPGNIWGIATPPEDWQKIAPVTGLPTMTLSPLSNAETAPTPANSFSEKVNGTERKGEVTMFPGPTTPIPTEEATPKDSAAPKDRMVVNAEQLMQALQGKLQAAADRAVQTALSAQIDEVVKGALGKIEDGWKANVRQTQEFSAAKLRDAQTLWDSELHSYRDRAEEVARRIEALTTMAQQALGDSQKFVERFATETGPQLQGRVNEEFSRAHADFESRVAEVSANQLAQLNENARNSVGAAQAHLEGSLAEARAFSVASVPPADMVTTEALNAQVASVRSDTSAALDRRLNDLRAGFDQQVDLLRNRMSELAHQLEGIALESRQARAQHEQGIADLRTAMANVQPEVSREHLETTLNSSREQLLNHLEWRLGEVSGLYDQHLNQVQNRATDLSQQLERISGDMQNQLTETRTLAERASRGLAPHDLATIEQAVGNATREFENAAARVSDRQLIRMMEQKQVVTREASLELEARATEARVLLQKTSNTTMEEFRRRIEAQIDQILAESNERAASSLASLDAESRATVEARRRTLEADVARAAEQSTVEFRSGMKAFLYSCLVAAVGAVDQHAQTTLAGLTTDPKSTQKALETSAADAAMDPDAEFPPKAASTSE